MRGRIRCHCWGFPRLSLPLPLFCGHESGAPKDVILIGFESVLKSPSAARSMLLMEGNLFISRSHPDATESFSIWTWTQPKSAAVVCHRAIARIKKLRLE